MRTMAELNVEELVSEQLARIVEHHADAIVALLRERGCVVLDAVDAASMGQSWRLMALVLDDCRQDNGALNKAIEAAGLYADQLDPPERDEQCDGEQRAGGGR